MLNKRKCIFIFIFLILTGFIFAQEKNDELNINWFTENRIWSLSVTEEAINYYDFMQYKLGLGIAGSLDMQELTSKVGVFFGNHKLNGTAQISYGPTINQKIKSGIKLINHLCYYVKYYFEYDFLIGPFIEYKTDSLFKTNLSFFYMQKSSYIQNLPNKNRLVYSSCPAFFFDFYFYPQDWMFINLSFSSFSFYRYFLFCSPDIKLAFDFIANNHLTLEVAGEIQAVDFFTMSANFNNLGFSVSADWRF